MVAQQDLSRAYHLLDACQARLEIYELWTYALKALVAQACVLNLLGEQVSAQEQMQRALSLAEPEGFIRIFVDLGEKAKLLITRCRSALSQQMNGGNDPSTMRLT